jgi:hypothetical protein
MIFHFLIFSPSEFVPKAFVKEIEYYFGAPFDKSYGQGMGNGTCDEISDQDGIQGTDQSPANGFEGTSGDRFFGDSAFSVFSFLVYR